MTKEKKTGLELMREPFEPHLIGKLPKPTSQQTEEVKKDFKKGIRCDVCGGWHHPKVIHLDYVGHAALTDRLLDCDPAWTWEPLAVVNGLPAMDANGGMWIKLTVCGQTRLGYGSADGKTGSNAVKEVIGDALRNAAMRFGAALDLWHKGDLHDNAQAIDSMDNREQPKGPSVKAINDVKSALLAAETLGTLKAAFMALPPDLKSNQGVINAKDARKAELELINISTNADLGGDEIPL